MTAEHISVKHKQL